jgi:hypothetical protein
MSWADKRHRRGKKMVEKHHMTDRTDTAQVHVSFISKQIDYLISEATLRSLFSRFGEVVDVALKKSQFDEVLKTFL